MNPICPVRGCTKRHYGLGYCAKHYVRLGKRIPRPKEFGADILITVTEFARLLGVHRYTVIRWEQAGKIAPFAHTPGGHKRVRLLDAVEFMNDTMEE